MVAKSRIFQTHRTIVQENIGECPRPEFGLSPLVWNGRCHSPLGSPSIFWSVVWFSFTAERERENSFSHHVQGSTTVEIVHSVLRPYDRCGLGNVYFFDRGVPGESCSVHMCESLFL